MVCQPNCPALRASAAAFSEHGLSRSSISSSWSRSWASWKVRSKSCSPTMRRAVLVARDGGLTVKFLPLTSSSTAELFATDSSAELRAGRLVKSLSGAIPTSGTKSIPPAAAGPAPSDDPGPVRSGLTDRSRTAVHWAHARPEPPSVKSRSTTKASS